MNLALKKIIFWLVPALALLSLGWLIVRNPTNVACTAPSHPDPDLRTRQYPRTLSLPELRKITEETITGLRTYGSRWRLRNTEQINDPHPVLTIQTEVPVLFFTDDLEVKIQPSSDGRHWLVDVRSASRTGKSDLGENRRHIKQFLSALSKKLPNL
jgi:hypothetical protein